LGSVSEQAALRSDPVFRLEETFTKEFEEYFKQPLQAKINTENDVRNRTREIEQATGIKTGVIYVSFIPTSMASPESQCQAQLLSRSVPPLQGSSAEARSDRSLGATPLTENASSSASVPYSDARLPGSRSANGATSPTPMVARSHSPQVDRRFGYRRSDLEKTTDEPSPQQGSCSTPQSDQLELLLITAEGESIRQRVTGANRAKVLAVTQEFQQALTNPRKTHTTDYLRSAQQLYRWLIAPLEADIQARHIQSLVFAMDSGLRALPVAALHDGKRFLVERYSASLVPSLSLNYAPYRDIRSLQVLAMGASKFVDQPPLPGVQVELATITQQLWKGESFLNDAFTLENLKAQLRQNSFGIVHLATHAEFNPGSPHNSYIQLWDRKLRLNELDTLRLSDPPVDLLVLSACRTALGDKDAELGFAGSALQAGVKSTLATLWYVSDQGALGLMTEFYRHLGRVPSKTEALRSAQLAMIRGSVRIENNQLHNSGKSIALPPGGLGSGNPNLSHPYYWAAFTLVGDP